MTATLLISVAIALLAFAHGVVILGKASRENHGAIYKIAGWFIIIASLIVMGCSAIHSAIHFYRWRYMGDTMELRGKQMMDWMRGDGHRYYDGRDYRNNNYDDDMDGDYDRNYYRGNREAYRNNRRYDYSAPSDTSRRSGTTR